MDDISCSRELTRRQKEVLRLAREGYTNERIAMALGISRNTVKHHFTAAFEALRTDDRTRAVLKAINLGMISLWNDDMATREGVGIINDGRLVTVGGRAGTDHHDRR